MSQDMIKKRVAVALSGGVDSSTAAFLLHRAGHEVIGLTMRLWSEEKTTIPTSQHQFCYPTQGIREAEQFCLFLGIPFHVINLENEFRQYVIDYFCQEYAWGRTPNPCIICNKHIKFGFLLREALSLGAEYLATGHYARIEYFNDAYHLFKGIDSDKDQSYMLYALEQDKLSQLLFPLGNYLKAEVRELAQRNGLPTASRPSSQDICFVSGNYGAFLKQHCAMTPGEIIDRQGKVLGKHEGTALYTVGQRQNLGITATKRLYVTKIEPDTHQITVGSEEELFGSRLTASKVNWVSGEEPLEPMVVTVKIRYRSPEVAATLYPKPDAAEIRFHLPQRAIAPGQAAVFYQDSEVLGGGTIES